VDDDCVSTCALQICGFIKTQGAAGGGGRPGEVICRVAEHDAVTMIVVGTRGLGSVRRTIMGSVSASPR